MFRFARITFLLVVFVALAAVQAAPAAAQSECPGLTPQSLARVTERCAFDKTQSFANTACYANEIALFNLTTGELPSGGAIISLEAVRSIRTAGEGAALMNVQPAVATAAPFYAIVVGEAELERVAPAAPTDAPAYFIRTNTNGCPGGIPAAVGFVSREENSTVSFSVNGAAITQGSITIFRVLPPGNTLQLITVEGVAFITTDAGPASVTAGNSALICLGEAQNIGLDGQPNDRSIITDCNWTEPQPLSDEELEFAGAFQNVVVALRGGVAISTSVCPNGGQNLIHTVRRGETLGRIAARYSTTAGVVARENNIFNIDVIYPGQQLSITCAIDTGRSTIPVHIPPVVPPRPGS